MSQKPLRAGGSSIQIDGVDAPVLVRLGRRAAAVVRYRRTCVNGSGRGSNPSQRGPGLRHRRTSGLAAQEIPFVSVVARGVPQFG